MAKSPVVRFLFFVGALGLVSTATTQAQGVGPYQFYSVTPCRIVDTRNPVVPAGTGGPHLTSGPTRSFPVTGYCGVPTGAKAAVLNVTFVGATADGFLAIWPYNTTPPLVSTINAAAGEPAIANGAIVPLAADPSLSVSVAYGTAQPGTADLILDVTGYFK